ncbi:acetyl-CoA C-acetyltransferase [Litorihabitans aurantiacus]|uniref:Acetyl-CoA acetyltransferase n=1 Tax=Litorihabitans aurantiacus TaxID=1930061 RepID=A0AA37UNG6_9MICO|nr:acetyl-CoA C-acetyltransferase [Litorihabitans aurantiacus]GMA30176.1 acetyl-CoA acetyltransferase [Litorihabitans aurantiacus]
MTSTPETPSPAVDTGSAARPSGTAVVVGGNRIPFAKAGGHYAGASNLDMLTAVLDGLVARLGLAGETIGEVRAGAVLNHSKDFNLAREAVLGTALAPTTSAVTIQRACATSIEAAWDLANKITLGQISSGIAGGADSTSDAPIVVSERLRGILLKLNRARSVPDRLKLVGQLRPADLAPVAPNVNEPRTGLSMGEHQALTNLRWQVTREAQDAIALASHTHLAQAWEEGLFDDLVTPFRGLTRDAALRADTTAEALAKLRTVFGNDHPDPTMTAGNSTPLSDGAAAVLLASPQWAAEHGLPALARVVDAEAAAVDFVHGEEGLLMGGAYAVPRLLARQGLALEDIDLVEIHEAFAGVVAATTAAWADETFAAEKLGLPALGTLDPARLNVAGSSLAAGHPFAATGARIVATLATLLAGRKAALVAEGGSPDTPVRGLISVCAAGGQAVAMLLEA